MNLTDAHQACNAPTQTLALTHILNIATDINQSKANLATKEFVFFPHFVQANKKCGATCFFPLLIW